MSDLLARSSPDGRAVLAAVTLGSGVALLDSTVVNVALRSIGRDLDAGLASLQWVVTGYLLALAALILLGGALGDRYGRRRCYVVGVAGFGATSLLCAAAPTATVLVLARVLQGVAAALLTPGSLAILQSTLRVEDRAPAIGTWAGVSGLATAAGPLVGGFVLEHAGWRWVFLLNLPLCAIVVWLCRRVPESRDPDATGRFDVVGAATAALALGLVTLLLTIGGELAVATRVLLVLAALAAAVVFVVRERRPGAMLPLVLFRSRVFTAANLMTFLVYGALGAVLFLLVLQLQVSAGYSPLSAGLSTLPITVLMLLLSARTAEAARRVGPRLPMTVGPLVCAAGLLLLRGVDGGAPYWREVLPGVVVFGLGLVSLVSPLTAAVLAAVEDRHAGVASGVNNAVARTGTLLAVATLPAVVGLSGEEYRSATLLTEGYREGTLICAGLLAVGGLVSWWGLAGTGTPAPGVADSALPDRPTTDCPTPDRPARGGP